MKRKEFKVDNLEEEMTSISKWFAYVLFLFVLVFLLLVFFKPNFLQQFMNWTLGIIGLITAGTVVYIIINFNKKKRRY